MQEDRPSPAATAVEACLGRSGAAWRRVAPGEWGISAEAGGRPLHAGIALRGGLLRVRAEVLGPGRADPHALLLRNRRLLLARLAHTSAGAVWVHAEIPERAVDEAEVDRLLGVVLEVAGDVREAHGAG